MAIKQPSANQLKQMRNQNGFEIGILCNHRCILGESVVWDEQKKMISWVDIEKGEIHEYLPDKEKQRTIPVRTAIGSIAVCSDGNYIAAIRDGIAVIDRSSGRVELIACPEAGMPGNRFNDGKCDPAGRFWTGTMSLGGEAHKGNVYVLDEAFTAKKRIEGVSVSNGMAWDIERAVFYYIDTPTFSVTAYDYDIKTSRIDNKRTAFRIPEEEGAPDGMTIDSEGMLWIAHWNGWQVARWNPDTGEKLSWIQLPVSRVTSCTFGGPDMERMFITTAQIGLSKEELEDQPFAGCLFEVKNCGYRGFPAYKFKKCM